MIEILQETLSLPLFVALILVIAGQYFFILSPAILLMNFLDRKLGADLQARIGPNQAGMRGLFQPIADGLKLLQKTPHAQQLSFSYFWFLFVIFMSFTVMALLPLSAGTVLLTSEIVPFVLIFSLFAASLGTLLMSERNSLLERQLAILRFTAQAVSGLFPVIIATLTVGLEADGFSWGRMIEHDMYWSPFHYMAFFAFFIGGLTSLALPPFEATSKQIFYYGVWQKIWNFNRSYMLLMWSITTTAVFLGGWSMPEVILSWLNSLELPLLVMLLQILIVLMKSMVLIALVIWVARVNPRVRVDHITELSWKFLSPLSVIALMGTLALIRMQGGVP